MTSSNSLVSSCVKTSAFANEKASKSLRVCCFGSSSSQTPDVYMRPSAEVGYLLGVRGHVCVNGAGSYGCMGAMNDGALEGNGHILGVTHEMWITQGEDSRRRWNLHRPLRDTGAHPAFASTVPQYHGSSSSLHVSLGNSSSSTMEPIRQLLVATGKDLQERKKLLIDNSDALVVMPGGPGTFDELWEMACARNLGMSTMPLVCVNTDGFYDSFRIMLERAWEDKLTKLPPEQILHFADTPDEAIRWVERVYDDPNWYNEPKKAPVDKEMLRHSSALGGAISTTTSMDTKFMNQKEYVRQLLAIFVIFAVGFLSGGALMKQEWIFEE